ncbi:MAG: chemotaxis protein CheW [Candidatus Acidiferrales bacterium]
MATPPAKLHAARTEQIILFRVSGQLFAVSSASVQEVRSVDSLSGAATEINQPSLRKVRHVLRRGDKALYVINAAVHFGLPASSAGLVFVLRKTRTALLVDGMDKMATMTRLQSLPLAYCHEERNWYRGLTALDQNVIPVVNPEGFLTAEEFALLDASLPPLETTEGTPSGSTELPQ